MTVSARLSSRLALPQVTRWNQTFLPLVARMRLAAIRERLAICRDPKDDAYLSLSRAVSADYLVTGDKDLLVLSRERLVSAGLQGLAIVTPKEFLARVGA